MRVVLLLSLMLSAHPMDAQDIPQSVTQTWTDFDPRAEPLETEIIRQSIDGGIVLRQVRYVVGTFAGKKTRVAAFYAYPEAGYRESCSFMAAVSEHCPRRLGSGRHMVTPLWRLTGASMSSARTMIPIQTGLESRPAFSTRNITTS